MSPLLPLLLKLFSNAFHPLLGTDEAMLVLALRHFGHQYLIAGLDQLAHVLEADQTIDSVSRLVRPGGEEIETAAKYVSQVLFVGSYDGDEEALRTLVSHAVPSFCDGTLESDTAAV
jgi:hypothetical protein